MLTRPKPHLFLITLLACLPLLAWAGDLPTWKIADEPWDSWRELQFKDFQGVSHSVWHHDPACPWYRFKACPKKTGWASLYVLSQAGKVLLGSPAKNDGHLGETIIRPEDLPLGAKKNWRTVYFSQLSAFTLNLDTEKVLDPRDKKEYATTRQPNLTAEGSVIRVLPPYKNADDAPKNPDNIPAAKPAEVDNEVWALAQILPGRNRALASQVLQKMRKGSWVKYEQMKFAGAPAVNKVYEAILGIMKERNTHDAQQIYKLLAQAAPGKKSRLDIVMQEFFKEPGSRQAAKKPTDSAPGSSGRKGSAGQAQGDPVEKAVMECLNKKPSPGKADVMAKLNALLTAQAAGKLTDEDRGLETCLAGKGLSQKELLAYFCPKRPAPSPASQGQAPAREQLDAAAGQGALAKTSEGEQAKALSDFQTSPALDTLCNNQKAEDAAKQPPDQTGAHFSEVPSLTADAQTQTGQDKKEKPKSFWEDFKLDAEGARDATAWGALAGGVIGMMAMATGAGAAGVIGAVIIGGLIGFGVAALWKGSEKKDE